MLFIYGLTIFVSSSLLFLVQPMFARMALPSLGGTPAVWNTCQVFFQACLLLGYGDAHVSTKRLGVRRQAQWHVGLMLLPLLALPVALPAWAPPTESNPVGWLLGVLAVSVGLPFFVVSTSNPLLQRWFASTGHPAARDPYFLYAASNTGSMLALLAYPLVVEPMLTLSQQGWLWAGGYVALVVLVAVCAVLLRQSTGGAADAAIEVAADPAAPAAAPVTAARRWRWVLLSLAPSSLMLGVTTHITTIASAPMLWIVPLALYLLSFILVFASRPPLPHALMNRLLPLFVIPLAITTIASMTQSGRWWALLWHLATFFIAAMMCHGELARDRPGTRDLTAFYFWMSLGGCLGGTFNALVAPLLFRGVAEYPLALVLVCLLRPTPFTVNAPTRRDKAWDFLAPLLLAAVCVGLVAAFGRREDTAVKLALFGLPAFACFAFADRPRRFALGLGVLFLMGTFHAALNDTVLHVERSFFGVHRVTVDPTGTMHRLEHGTTLHGWQDFRPDRQCVPQAYYHPDGPIGQIYQSFADGPHRSVAVVGLGSGGMAAYGQGRKFTFFEIDPAVKRIAEDPALFTYLSGCLGGRYDVILGDGRLRIAESPDGAFGLIFLDAFSSDAVPVHLLTVEAARLYLTKLAPGGVLIFHISNRNLDLEPLLAGLAGTLDLACLVRQDLDVRGAGGRVPSHVAVMARTVDDLAPFALDDRWRDLTRHPRPTVWTDDYSNILGLIKR